MPLKMPTLDDRTYADLVREGKELIPRHAPEWTNHNAADPGITLVELFAYLTEIYLYRVDRISDANKAKFLKLLLGQAAPLLPGQLVDRHLQQAVSDARRPFRAVSAADFERLALEAVRGGAERPMVARAWCFARRNLEAPTAEERQRDRPGHISLLFVPGDPWITDGELQSIRERIKEYVEPRRLLTSRLHVVGPRYVGAGIRIRADLSAGFIPAVVEQRIRLDLERFFDVRHGGEDHSGWPLGRSVYTADIYRRVGTIAGVSRVIAIHLDVQAPGRLRRSEGNEVVGVELEIGELFRIVSVTCQFSPGRTL
jgi:hypothetical protein